MWKVGIGLTTRGLRCSKHYYLRWSSSSVRVRFAPSPTGQLHLGGLRTALYNYLFARSQGGSFLLRIEDTDQTRLVPGAMEKLIRMLEWAGIQIDEGPCTGGQFGPYIQSERIHIYKEKAQHLLENGSAYHCFCTPKRLELLKKEALRQRETPRYDNRCRHLTDKQVQEKLEAGMPYVIRFKLEHYEEPWEDLVYGSVVHDVAAIEGDPILLKTDQYPTYHFANVVDDHLMEISHVLRGVEWQVSTTKHILLYKAFGWQPPKFGHLPLILNRDGSKLSKRQDDIHVEHFWENGYLPEAVLNLITHAGSGFTVRNTAGMNIQQLIDSFDLSTMNTNSTRIDMDMAKDFNSLHLQHYLNGHQRASIIHQLKQLVREKFGERLRDSSLEADILSDEHIGAVLDWATKERISFVKDLLEPNFHFLWSLPDVSCLTDLPSTGKGLRETLEVTIAEMKLLSDEILTQEQLGPWLKTVAKGNHLKFGPYMKTLRMALSGLKEGPSVAEMVCILGKERTLQRLNYSLEKVQQQR